MYYYIDLYIYFTKIGSSHNYKVPLKCIAIAVERVYSKAQHNIEYTYYNGHYYSK